MAVLKSVRLAVIVVSLFLSSTAAIPTGHIFSHQAPEEPSVDPFYQLPPGFESQAPGTTLRQRSLVTAFFSFLPSPVTAYQLLFRTTATNGSAIAGVTTVFQPLILYPDRFTSFHMHMIPSRPCAIPATSISLVCPRVVTSRVLLQILSILLFSFILRKAMLFRFLTMRVLMLLSPLVALKARQP